MTTMTKEPASLDRNQKTPLAEPAIGSSVTELTEAIQKYFDLMYDCDTSRFEQTFRSTVQLHGFRDGQILVPIEKAPRLYRQTTVPTAE
ncbi:MAG: hypothetical protein U0987_03470, partial [Afipia sp.]|nr:hypothetical protein [Afipia sp.]